MAKFNQLKETEHKTSTHEGGTGYKQSPEMSLYSILANGLGNNYYENERSRVNRMASLMRDVAKKDPWLAAKMLVYVRSEVGQRSSTHLGAAMLAKYLSGTENGYRFFTKRNRKKNEGGVVYRIDDMLEIEGAYKLLNPGKPISNAMKKGFRRALEQADGYELAKYKATNRFISLHDMVNICHPRPSDNAEALEKLMNGDLKQHDTMEDKHTTAGQKVSDKLKSGEISESEAEQRLKEKKAENWRELLESGKIGYLALLRNMRNIMQQAPDMIDMACDMLTDESRVRKSLVFPHQIDLALEVLMMDLDSSTPGYRKVIEACSEAYEMAIPNMTDSFDGNTAVVVDSSGSMRSNGISLFGDMNRVINKTSVEKASLIGATFAKATGADMYHFATDCEQIKYNHLDSMNTIKQSVVNKIGKVGHGTNFECIFNKMHTAYDRIFILSDMQGHDDITKSSSYQKYKRQNSSPYIYTVNLCGYGTTMFNPRDQRVFQLFGYGSDIYELAQRVEIDPAALMIEIENISI